MLFADLLSLHLVTFLMLFILVCIRVRVMVIDLPGYMCSDTLYVRLYIRTSCSNKRSTQHTWPLICFASMILSMATNLTFAIVMQKPANNILLTVKRGEQKHVM